MICNTIAIIVKSFPATNALVDEFNLFGGNLLHCSKLGAAHLFNYANLTLELNRSSPRSICLLVIFSIKPMTRSVGLEALFSDLLIPTRKPTKESA